MSEPEELECELVLEDNDDFKDSMAEPYGTARHLVAEDGMIRRCQPMADTADLTTLPLLRSTSTAASEEVAQSSQNTVSQWQTCGDWRGGPCRPRHQHVACQAWR